MNKAPAETKTPEFRRSCACYRVLLRLYPRAHREQFGDLMLQHFRDQCRDASRSGRCGWMRFVAAVGSDFFSSIIQENLSSTNIMIRQLASTTKLPGILLVTAVLLGLISCNLAASGHTPVAAALAYASLLTLVGRGFAELYRSPQQWLRGMIWAGLIFVIYGFIMPLWARFHLVPASESGWIVILLFAGLGLNLLVPIGKAIIALRARIA
jgi:hypothetical protein